MQNKNTKLETSAVAVVIPAYNEVATIRNVAAAALNVVPNVIVVDDGSQDGTAKALEGIDAVVIRHDKNQGKAASLWDGMQYALHTGASVVITMDGDGQHSPNEIPMLMDTFNQHPDTLVIAARLLKRENAPKARLFANNFADFWVSWAAGQCIFDSQSGYRLYPAKLIQRVNVPHHRSRGFVFESEFVIEACRHRFDCIAVPVESIYHSKARASHFRPVLDITRIVLMIAWKILSRALNIPGLLKVLRCRSKIPVRISKR